MREPVGRHRRGLERRRHHAERPQDIRGHVVGVRHARHATDDAAEDHEAVVGVLVGDAGRVRKRNAAAQHLRELIVADRELLISPRVVFGKAFRMREQVANGDLRRVGCRIFQRCKFRHVLLRRIVERELAFVAQLEDRHRGEALGHRGDTEDGVGVRRRFRLEVAIPRRAGVHQLAVDDDAPRRTGDVVGGSEVLKEPVDVGEVRLSRQRERQADDRDRYAHGARL